MLDGCILTLSPPLRLSRLNEIYVENISQLNEETDEASNQGLLSIFPKEMEKTEFPLQCN